MLVVAIALNPHASTSLEDPISHEFSKTRISCDDEIPGIFQLFLFE
jgi:hypothetical protein